MSKFIVTANDDQVNLVIKIIQRRNSVAVSLKRIDEYDVKIKTTPSIDATERAYIQDWQNASELSEVEDELKFEITRPLILDWLALKAIIDANQPSAGVKALATTRRQEIGQELNDLYS